jgi:serine/threonine protein kinase
LKPELEGSQVFDGKYLIERRLGHGAMGVVYQVRHLGLQKRLALKMIHPGVRSDNNFLSRFKTEAEVLGRLSHPNIVSVTDFGIDMRGNGTPYLVMEYLEGESLDSYLKREGRLDLNKSLSFLRELADGLDYAHGKGVLHRDLKPSNIFIVKDQNRESVKILDFGVARFFKADFSTLTMLGIRDERVVISGKESEDDEDTGSRPTYLDAYYRPTQENQENADPAAHRNIVGTWIYMAPEVFRGKPPTVATDIYAFGILIYEMMTGQPPFRGNIMYLRNHHLHKPVPSPSKFNSELPRDLVKPILAPLAKAAEDRPQTANQTVGQLQLAFHQAESRRWRSAEQPRRWWIAAGLSLAMLILIGVLETLNFGRAVNDRIYDHLFLGTPPQDATSTILISRVHEAEIASPKGGQAPEAMARFITEAFDAGATHVAVNILLPKSWSRSAAWNEMVIRYHHRMTFACFFNLQGQLVGTAWAEQGPVLGVLGEEKTAAMFGLSNVLQDSDGVLRKGHLSLNKDETSKTPTFPALAVSRFTGEPVQNPSNSDDFPLNFAIDTDTFSSYKFKYAITLLNTQPEAYAGKLVLIGYTADDEPFLQGRVPHVQNQRDRIESTQLQAITIQTILDRFPVRSFSLIWQLLILEVAFLILAWFFLQYQRLWIPYLVLFAVVLCYLLLVNFLFKYYLIQVSVFVPALSCALFVVLIQSLRRFLGSFPGDQTMGGSMA